MAANVKVSARQHIAIVKRFSKPLLEKDVQMNFNPNKFNRKTTEDLDKKIDEIWAEKSAKNDKLFNGSKFRQAGYCMKEGNLEVDVGLTCYKDLVGTNLREDVTKLMEESIKTYGDSCAMMSHPLAVGIVLLTSDDHVIILKRSMWTGECAGMYDRPGGHPEPSEVKILEDYTKNTGTVSEEDINKAIRSELFNSVVREVQDEVGLKDPITVYLTGVTHSIDIGDRPTFDFIGRLSQSSSEVKALYSVGDHLEADESTGIWLMSPAETKEIFTLIPKIFTYSGDLPSYPPDAEDTEGGEVITEEDRNKLTDLLKNNFAPALTASLLLASDFILNKTI